MNNKPIGYSLRDRPGLHRTVFVDTDQSILSEIWVNGNVWTTRKTEIIQDNKEYFKRKLKGK